MAHFKKSSVRESGKKVTKHVPITQLWEDEVKCRVSDVPKLALMVFKA